MITVDLGGTKISFTSKKLLNFFKNYEKRGRLFFARTKDTNLLEFIDFLEKLDREEEVLLAIAGKVYYKRGNFYVKSDLFNLKKIKLDLTLVVNDVVSFGYYWGTKFNRVLALQIGTGFNAIFFTRSLLGDFEYVINNPEFSYTFEDIDIETIKKISFVFMPRYVVIGGGRAFLFKEYNNRIIDNGFVKFKIKIDSSYETNHKGLLKIYNTFKNIL